MLRSRTLQEGTVGLFALIGLVLFGGLVIWLRGGVLGQKPYQIQANFQDVSGLQIGAPVNFRGVAVGKITALQASSNGVTVLIEVSSRELRIPIGSTIQINRYGLIGEASVDITPSEKLSDQALAVDPTSEECPDKQLIICDNDTLDGETGSQLVQALTRLSNAYSDPEFVKELKGAFTSVAQAGTKIGKLSDEAAIFSKTARREIQGTSQTIAQINQAARDASQLMRNVNTVVSENRESLNRAVNNAASLVNNLNGLVSENRGNVINTLNSLERTSDEVRMVAIGLGKTVNKVNSGIDEVNIKKIARDLEILMANAAETSANLRDISQSFNDPTVILTVQKTLDSARATFENAQKITSDVEELTGDPAFRDNVRKLINGLSNLLSYTNQLEQQIYTAQLMESVTEQLEYQVAVQQRFLEQENANQTTLSRDSSIPPQVPVKETPKPVRVIAPEWVLESEKNNQIR
ncbi:Mammalian cell entry related domain protein [Rippkaea orientalis PCC 8801]|uniref:Mammalian cell entry related domain protein n=1 Tax=Rippkaea orientalis (strain PCC 8801 / RF-1) TaxID=41431 RepID=B7JVN3_RIPO1|nr:MlaD family protein [Rippkaea orientalis]ACK64604.1 Mammalian cell entry related domain protein [Rippkaea orientalis PCC 8801]